MYNIIKNEIKNGRKLTEVNHLLNVALGAGTITDAQYSELRKEANDKANHNDNQPDLREMVLALAARVTALEANAGIMTEPEQPEEGGNSYGYEKWQPWDGISNKYQMGAIVYHPGTEKLWESTFAGQNTWEPGTIGTEALWREYDPT